MYVVVLPIHLGVDVDERMNKFLLDIPNVDHLEASWTLGSSRPRSLECLQWIQDLGPAAGDSCPRAGSSERRVSAVNRVQKPRLGRSTYGAYTHQLGHWTRGQCWQPCRRPCHTWSVWLRKLTELRLTCLLIKRFLVNQLVMSLMSDKGTYRLWEDAITADRSNATDRYVPLCFSSRRRSSS